MSCSIEMLPCEECGQEVIFFHIRVITDDEGERKMVCAECAGEEIVDDIYQPAPSCN